MNIKRIRAAMASLEADGILERTGEFRRNPKTGELRPVYRLTEKGKSQEIQQRILLEGCPRDNPQ
jgi:DNA-binding PadR family transcriptional regulator